MKRFILILLSFITIVFCSYGKPNIEYNESIGEVYQVYEKTRVAIVDEKTLELNDSEKILKKKYDKRLTFLKVKFSRGITKDTKDDEKTKIIMENIYNYFKKEYKDFDTDVPYFEKNKNALLNNFPSEFKDEIVILDYNYNITESEISITTSIKKSDKNMLYKDLFLMKIIWIRSNNYKFINMVDILKSTITDWDPFFNNVKNPQYPWEEKANDFLSFRYYHPEDYILNDPNNFQLTLAHFTPTVEYNFDASETFTPALGIQLLGFRKYDPKKEFKESWGASYIITFNSDSDDNKPGHGIMFNYNKYDFGVIYRDSSRVDANWWLIFGINIATITENLEAPSSFKKLKELKED